MAGEIAPGADGRRWRVARRWAVALWLVFALAVWNVIFDASVIQGGREYLTRQILWQQGKGPGASMHGVMDEAVSRGARLATAAGAGVAAIGLTAVWLAGRRRARPLLRSGR